MESDNKSESSGMETILWNIRLWKMSDFEKCQIPEKIKSWDYRKADRENKPNGIRAPCLDSDLQ